MSTTSTLFNTIMLSPISTIVDSTVVVVPCTVKSPETVKFLPTVKFWVIEAVAAVNVLPSNVRLAELSTPPCPLYTTTSLSVPKELPESTKSLFNFVFTLASV